MLQATCCQLLTGCKGGQTDSRPRDNQDRLEETQVSNSSGTNKHVARSDDRHRDVRNSLETISPPTVEEVGMFVTNFRMPRPRGPKEIHHRMQKHPRQLEPRVLARPNRGPVPVRTSSMVELRSAVRTITPRPGAVPHREGREFRDPNEAPGGILRNHTGRRRARKVSISRTKLKFDEAM
jgi:hypothetical protein